jgi:hypothetical protein
MRAGETLTVHKIMLNSYNQLSVVIEKTWLDNFSIVAHDEDGGYWKECFTKTFKEARVKARKMMNSAKSEY